MRIVLLFGFILFATGLTAQSIFQKQVEKIIADTPDHFRSFRALPKVIEGYADSVFVSAIQIEGTTENEIYRMEGLGWTYNAIVADTVKKKKGEKICDEWKKKMELILGAGFEIKRVERKSYNPANYGWQFSARKLSILLLMMPLAGAGEWQRICLSFDHE